MVTACMRQTIENPLFFPRSVFFRKGSGKDFDPLGPYADPARQGAGTAKSGRGILDIGKIRTRRVKSGADRAGPGAFPLADEDLAGGVGQDDSDADAGTGGRRWRA